MKKVFNPGLKTGYAYTGDMNDILVEKFNNKSFTRGSVVLKIQFYNPKNLIVQILPVKEKVKKLKLMGRQMFLI